MPGKGFSTTSDIDSLDCSRSGRVSQADLSKLGDELGISAGPAAAASAAAVAPDQDGHAAAAGDGGGDYTTEGSAVLKPSKSTSAGIAAAAAAAAAKEDGEDDEEEKIEVSASAAPRLRNKDHRASFDGYDFNTLRKVGSAQWVR